MKKIILLLILAAIMLGEISCKKDDNKPRPDTYSKMSARINGLDWNTGASAIFDKNNNGHFGLSMNTYRSGDNLWIYGLGISRIDLSLNSQTLHQTKGALNNNLPIAMFSTGVDDEVYDFFDVLPNDTTSQLVIDSYDGNSKIAAGHFNVTLVLDRTSQPNKTALYGFPDTLRITEGKFNAIIHEFPQ